MFIDFKQTVLELFKTCCESETFAPDRYLIEIEDFYTELDVLNNPDLYPQCFSVSDPFATGYEFILDAVVKLRIYCVEHYVITPKYRIINNGFFKKKTKELRSEEIEQLKKLYNELGKYHNAEFVEEEDRYSMTTSEYYLEFGGIRIVLTANEYAELEHHYHSTIELALGNLALAYLDEFTTQEHDDDDDDLDEFED